MRVRSGVHSYDWVEGWVGTPQSSGWAHHGTVVTETGQVMTCDPAHATILILDQEGNVQSSWKSGLTEAHGMTLVMEEEAEFLWIADNGRKRVPELGYEYTDEYKGQVAKFTLDGTRVMSLERPDIPVYGDMAYSPTWVAVNDEHSGGNGDIWVADGYGSNRVHRYSKAGEYIGSISGEEGDAGAFDCPHGLLVDRRKREPELYIGDRSNGRVQVYDLDGRFKREFGSDFLTSPGGFAVYGELMLVVELRARITVLDVNDDPVAYLGDNAPVSEVEGWPNSLDPNGRVERSRRLRPGKFNSPHGLAVDRSGNLYVAEWLVGGRSTKLVRV